MRLNSVISMTDIFLALLVTISAVFQETSGDFNRSHLPKKTGIGEMTIG